ncbi:SCP2 sterol-binding domain-containing protein [Candidatus Thorarchaeota archaeon]|nr:MAG: SCP2 sterol-binding domain-containing protein [Candidatus Thorarchaeota archaeon]
MKWDREMVSEEDLLLAIEKMIERAEDPKIARRFTNYSKSLLMSFQDIELDIIIIFEDGKGTVQKGTCDSPSMKVTTDSKTIIDILGGDLSAMRAFMTGKIKADGPAKDLMKLQHLLKA